MKSDKENIANKIFENMETKNNFQINTYAAETYYGYIFSSDGYLQIMKDSVRYIFIERVDSVPMGCTFLTEITKEYNKFSFRNVKKN